QLAVTATSAVSVYHKEAVYPADRSSLSMWSSAGPHNKTSIEEANKHLSAMMERVAQLEARCADMEAQAQQKDAEAHQMVSEMSARYQREMDAMGQKLSKATTQVNRLTDLLERKDHEMRTLRQRCQMVDELVQYKTALAKITITLEQVEQFTKYNVNREAYDPREKPREPSTNERLLQRAANGSAGQQQQQLTLPNGEKIEKELYA
ncbi:hypothetical protein BOX15_Mlig032660g1, partial [Macrostomum lignano]